MRVLYLAAITLHALAGLVMFAVGYVLVARPLSPGQLHRWLLLYGAALTGLIAFMVTAIFSHWPELSVAERFTFTGLIGLGLYMAWRSWRAWRLSRLRRPGWESAFIDHVGFNLISLFDGFVIVAAIDLQAPGWVVAVAAVLGVVAGVRGLARIKQKRALT